MTEFLKKNKIFIGIMIISLVASLFVVGQRISVEKNDRNFDVVLDYQEMLQMSEQSKHDISWWLSDFADMGINKVGLYEESLESLTKSDYPVTAELAVDVKKDFGKMSSLPVEAQAMITGAKDNFDVFVTAGSDEMFNFICRAFNERYNPKLIKTVKLENGGYILIDGKVADSIYNQTTTTIYTDGVGFKQESTMADSVIMHLDLGLLPEKVQLIQNAGCTVEPRVVSYEGWNDEKVVADVLDQYEKLGLKPDYWIMGSKVVSGFDDGTEAVTKYIKDNDITIGIVENTTQRENISPDGMEDIIDATDFNVVRVFSVWPYIQYRYKYYGYDSYQEIENSIFRAVVERNIKIVYYKPMKDKDDSFTYITDPKMYKESFESLENRLERHHITLGTASASKPYQVPLLAKMLIAIGAGCAALICLGEIFPMIRKKWLYILLGIGVVGVAGAYFVAPNAAGLLTSFASSVMVPCIAVIWMIYEGVNLRNNLDRDAGVSKIMIRGGAVLIAGVLVSLAAAMMTAAPISSINYMLELDIFRGVKLAQLLPLAFFMLMFVIMAVKVWGKEKDIKIDREFAKSILNYNIKIWVILLGVALLVVGYIYIARTGHETKVGASSIELIVRNYLEDILYARPRTKEFLVAFPSVMLFIYCMVRDWKIPSFVFGLAGVIGFTSVTNTFMHIRTPMELGFARTGYSIILGIVLGVIYVLIIDVIYKACRKWGNRRNA